MLRRTIVCIALAAFACGHPRPTATTTVLVVRHAEKGAVGTDADLNAAGVAHARALAAALAGAHVDAVYVTQYRRTRETAQPLIDATHAAVLQVGIDLERPGDYPQRVAGTIRERESGKTVLVVTHLNVLPQLVKALAGVAIPPPRADEYDQLYVVTLREGAPASVIAARY